MGNRISRWGGTGFAYAGDYVAYSSEDLSVFFITNLFLNGIDPRTAQSLVRHSDISLTMNVYTHLNAQTQINAINALTAPRLITKNYGGDHPL